MSNSATFTTEEQKEAPSLLVGKTVVYSITKDTFSQGLVLDKISMKEGAKSEITVSGYLIEDDITGEINPIAYWRIKKKCQPKLKGSYNRSTRSENV